MKKQIFTFFILATIGLGGALSTHAIVVVGVTTGRAYDCSKSQVLCSTIPEQVTLNGGPEFNPAQIFTTQKYND